MASTDPCLVIPAYQPGPALLELARKLRAATSAPIILVNDGSADHARPVFDELRRIPGLTVIEHAVNLGKGAALKTAFNHLLVAHPMAIGAVTLDADGQHLANDVLQVFEALKCNPTELSLGVRRFGSAVPLRSRFGNILTRQVFRQISGSAVEDTQTGLRGIPSAFLRELLRLKATGYEFEMDMLLRAPKLGFKFREIPIRTVYLDGNASSHFNPLVDSARIYFVFVRFVFSSVATSAIDFGVFGIAHALTDRLLLSSFSGRLVAGTFNFLVGRRLVFRSGGAWLPEATRYFLLVFALMFVSNGLIITLIREFGIGVLFAKALAETGLFLASFAIQRVLVFAAPGGPRPAVTDWDAYYDKPFKAASVTRKITGARILSCLKTATGESSGAPITILELGGGNSAFFPTIDKSLKPSRYLIVDNNRKGLDRFRENHPGAKHVSLIEQDLLSLESPTDQPVDVCMSVGVIEHFSVEDTKKAIAAHFRYLKPGGVALITFPTPTPLYRATRFMAELLKLWAFHDEVPRKVEDVVAEVSKHAKIEHVSIIWPIFLTQGIIVARR